MTDDARVERLNRACLAGYGAFLRKRDLPRASRGKYAPPSMSDVRGAYRAGWMAGVAALGHEVAVEMDEEGEQA